MKTRLALVALCAAFLSSCADLGGPYEIQAEAAPGVYYDDYYGPYYGGYWGRTGDFYYFDLGAMRYRRDRLGHFRRDPMAGYHAVQGQPQPEHRRPNRPNRSRQ